MSVLTRRVGTAVGVALLALGLTLPAHRAHAAPETLVRDGLQHSVAAALEKQVRQRQQVLQTLNRRADARDRALVGIMAVLAQYGYTGDPDEVRVVLPLASYRVTAGFGVTGPLWEAEHGGQDFVASVGDPIVAVAAGEVTEVAQAGPYGLRTIVTLPDGTEVWYCHQAEATVHPGQLVEVADVVGTVGSTGNSTGPHLHLEVRPDGGRPVDPMDWLRAGGLAP